METASGYSLRELADLTGFRQRTIRNYIQQGLIPGANGKGRGAAYPNDSLDGLLFMKAVRRQVSLGLDQVRRLLMQLPPERVRAIGLGEEALDVLVVEEEPAVRFASMAPPSHEALLGAPLEQSPIRDDSSFHPKKGLLLEEDNEALSFIRRLKAKNQSAPYTHNVPVHPTSRLERAAIELENTLPHRKPQRKARGEWWVNIPITPDLELRARGLDGDDLASLERIADTLRNLISKNSRP